MRLAKITQKSGNDVHVHPNHIVTVATGKAGETIILLDDFKTALSSASSVADVVKEINDAMK